MRRNTPFLLLLSLITSVLLTFGCGSGGGGGSAFQLLPDLIVLSPDSNGRVAALNGVTPVTIRVTDRSGAPEVGKNVTFVAPKIGAGGTFASPAEAPNVFRGQTDANGSVTANLTSNGTPGPFLVTAAVEESGQVHALAVTNANGAAAPALTADAARTQIRAKLLGGRADDETAKLYGPVLLPTGSQVRTIAPLANGSPFVPSPITRPSWFFWLDEAPEAQFGHSVKLIVLDAADAAAGFADRADIRSADWYPTITLPGGVSTDLLPAHEIDGNYAPVTRSAPRAAPVTRAEAPNDACAIILYGPRGSSQPIAADRYRQFLISTGKVKAGHVFPPTTPSTPSTSADIDAYIAQAKAAGCKKIFFAYCGHGGQELGRGLGGGFMELGPKTPGGDADLVTYNDLAARLGTLNAEMCIVIQACFSETAIVAFQNRGLTGTITTAANKTELAWKNDWYGDMYYIQELIFCWQQAAANTNGDDHVDQREAHEWVLAHAGESHFFKEKWHDLTLKGFPQVGNIGNAPPQNYSNLPTIGIIQPGDSVTVSIPLPPGVTPDQKVTGTLTINPPPVASVSSGTSIGLDFSGGPKSVNMQGIAFGTTSYTVSVRTSKGDLFTGTGVINVGSYLTATPNPVVLLANSTGLVNISKGGVLASTQDVVTAGVTSFSPTTVAVLQPTLVFPGGVPSQPLPLKAGFLPGETTITVTDSTHHVAVTFPARVAQQVLLASDLRLTTGGPTIYPEGTVITTEQVNGSLYIIEDYKISAPEEIRPDGTGCLAWHMHPANGKPGIIIKRFLGGDPPQFERLGPFPDPNPHSCGYGAVIQPP